MEPLLTSSDSPSGVPAGFITDFVNRYEHDGLADVCNSCVFDYIDFTPCLPTFILLSFPPWSRLSFAILLEARSSFMYFSKSLVAQLRMELASNFWAALFTACRIRGLPGSCFLKYFSIADSCSHLCWKSWRRACVSVQFSTRSSHIYRCARVCVVTP